MCGTEKRVRTDPRDCDRVPALRSGTMSHSIVEVIGVYDADSTLIGEVSYWIGARLGRTHCSLCELTHGLFRVKSEWVECSRSLGVPVTTYHRNDAPADVLAAAPEFPILMVRHTDGLRVAAGRDDLERFAGSTSDFVAWLHATVTS